ncbi:MAG: hypothetical protein HOV94_20455 [Saccharothrix sp.]|nr:hypothetical protein [Saccharothrix sp.]
MSRDALVHVDRVEVVPGALWATLSLDRRADEIWVFATQGLEERGAPEVVLAVRRDGPPPEQVFSLFRSIHDQASLLTGGLFEVERGAFDFDPRISGFACLPCSPDDPRLPAIEGTRRPPVLLVALLDGEFEAARRYGPLRVLALLGKLTRVFPHPWWFDSRRPAVAEPEPTHPDAASVLARFDLPTAHVPYLSVVHSGPRVRLSFAEEDGARLHALLSGAGESVLLLPGPGDSEDARYVWRPDQPEPEAVLFVTGDPVGHGDLVIGVNFLILLHGDVEAGAVQQEDGFTLVLPDELWRRFLDALADRRGFAWTASGAEIVVEPRRRR